MSSINEFESRSELVIALTATFTAISSVVFFLRLYTRSVLLRRAGADDWTMLVAQIMAMTASVATCIEAMYGLGRHVTTLSDAHIRKSLTALFIVILTYNLGLNIVKISFLFQYRRIFPNDTLHNICRWGLILIPIWTVIQLILLSLTCSPLELIVPSTHAWCLDTLPVWMTTSTVSLITDFAIFIIPLPLIWDLQIPRRQKVLVFGIFGLGFFVCIISIIRVPTLRAAAGATDPTFDNVAAALWTVAELNAAIMCSSLPILRPLVFRVSSSLSSATKRTLTRTTAAQVEFPPDHMGHPLTDMPYKETTTNRISRVGTNESSDDLVSAAYDDLMYRRGLPRQSLVHESYEHKTQSVLTTGASDASGDGSVGMDMPQQKQ